MEYLLMTYCMLGQVCKEEVVAQFPQWDVGHIICELARPAIEKGVRAKVSSNVTVTFECVGEVNIP